MLVYVLFAVLMPAMCYCDFAMYRKRLLKNLKEQPDYEQNTCNYDALYEKMCSQQKSTEISVCVVLVLAALVMGVLSTNIFNGLN